MDFDLTPPPPQKKKRRTKWNVDLLVDDALNFPESFGKFRTDEKEPGRVNREVEN